MPLDPRIQRLERAAATGDWPAQVALESELLRSGRPPRSNAARDAALHESRSAGGYYAAMLLDALRQAQAPIVEGDVVSGNWWPPAGYARPWPSVHETRALLVEPNDLSIERESDPSPRGRNKITLRLPDGLGHPRLLFHTEGRRSMYFDEQTGEWESYGPTLPPECSGRWKEICPGHVYGGIQLSVSAVYSRSGVVSRAVKLESWITGPYYLGGHVSDHPIYPPKSGKGDWSDAKFLKHAERLYCLAWDQVQSKTPSYQVVLKFEDLRDAWAASKGGDEAWQRKVRQEIYERVIEGGKAHGLAPMPEPPYRMGLLTPEQARGWHDLLDGLFETLGLERP